MAGRWRLTDDEAAADDSPPKANDKTPKLTVESIDNHVYFYADVDSDRCLALMRSIREIDTRLRNEYTSRSLPEEYPLTPIWLHIHSPGGYLFAGLSIADQLGAIKSPIYSIIEGYCASAATLISLSCTERYIMPSAFVLIHQVSTFAWGTYEQLKDEVHLLDMLMRTLTGFYAKHTKMKEGELKELLQHDSWFNAEQCIEKGLADAML